MCIYGVYMCVCVCVCLFYLCTYIHRPSPSYRSFVKYYNSLRAVTVKILGLRNYKDQFIKNNYEIGFKF